MKLIFAALITTIVTTCSPAHAQQLRCAETEFVHTRLSEADEHGSILEVWVNNNTEWVVLRSMPEGRSCYIVGGTNLVQLPVPNL